MSRADRLPTRSVLIVAAMLAAAPSIAHAQKAPKPRGSQEEQRRKLLEEMGLKKSDTPPPPPPAAVIPEAEPEAERAEPSTETTEKTDHKSGVRTGAPSTPAAPSFRRAIHPLLLQACKSCHASGAAAQATALVLSGDATLDHAAVRRVVDVRAPAASAMLGKASGQKLHGGGAPWPLGGAAYGRVLAWIQAGARLDGGAAVAPPAVASAARPAAPANQVRKPAPTPAAGAHPDEPAIAVPPLSAALAAEEPVADEPAPGAPPPAADDFAAVVHPLLVRTCAGCHGPVGPAAATRLVLSGEVAADYAKIRPLVDPTAPAGSPLLTKAAGEMHGGGPVLKAGTPELALLAGWVSSGALEHPPAPAPAMAAAPGGIRTAPPPTGGMPAGAAPAMAAPASPHPAPGDLGLPLGLMLNGRFDLAYERRGFSGSPLADDATNVLTSYHHFLFLSRESAADPFGLSLEVLSLQFWEAHFRWRPDRLPIRVLVSGGKIFVPFGADPLMHQSYGGLAGFDQKILPVIWAQEGAAAHLTWQRRALAVTDDIYVVHGYALRAVSIDGGRLRAKIDRAVLRIGPALGCALANELDLVGITEGRLGDQPGNVDVESDQISLLVDEAEWG